MGSLNNLIGRHSSREKSLNQTGMHSVYVGSFLNFGVFIDNMWLHGECACTFWLDGVENVQPIRALIGDTLCCSTSGGHSSICLLIFTKAHGFCQNIELIHLYKP